MSFNRRYFLFWLFSCSLTAAPSFIFSIESLDPKEFNSSIPQITARVLGVLVFVIGYTLLSSSAAFQKLKRNPIYRRAFFFAAIARYFQSVGALLIIFILATHSLNWQKPFLTPFLFCAILDGLAGEYAIEVVKSLGVFGAFERNPISQIGGKDAFLVPFAITVAQGILLNITLLLTMVLAVLGQVIWRIIWRKGKKSDDAMGL